MATAQELKDSIAGLIKDNITQDITGDGLQGKLFEMIDWTELELSDIDSSINGLSDGKTIDRILNQSLYLGTSSGAADVSQGYGNVGVGGNTLETTDGTGGGNNTAIGIRALQNLTLGTANTAVGTLVMSSLTTGVGNIGIGKSSNDSVTIGSYNIGMGQDSNYGVVIGTNNTSIGNGSGWLDDGSNRLSICNLIYGTGLLNDPQQIGTGKVGIGIEAPVYTLDVNGDIRGDWIYGDQILLGDPALIYASLHNWIGLNTNGFAYWRAAGNIEITIDSDDNDTTSKFIIHANDDNNEILVLDELGNLDISGEYRVNGSPLTLGATEINELSDAISRGLTNQGLYLGSSCGNETGTGQYNVGVGVNSGSGLTTGYGNVFVGYEAGRDATEANRSVAVGEFALRTITTATRVVAVGDGAGDSVTTGSNNVFVGSNAGSAITTAGNCVMIGVNAGSSSASGNGVLIGGNAGQSAGTSTTAIGYNCMNYNTATSTVAIGESTALYYGPSGTNNLTSSGSSIYIGSGVRAGANTVTNEIVIGKDTVGNGTNTTTIGGAATTDNYFTGNVDITGVFKINGTPITASTSISSGYVSAAGVVSEQVGPYSPTVVNSTTGEYVITHNFGDLNYNVSITLMDNFLEVATAFKTTNTISVSTLDETGPLNAQFMYMIHR